MKCVSVSLGSPSGRFLWDVRKDQGRKEEKRFCSWAPESTVGTCTHGGYRCNHNQCPSFTSGGGLLDAHVPCPFPGSRSTSLRSTLNTMQRS